MLDNTNEFGVALFPNPNDGLFTVQLSTSGQLSFDIIVFNNLGMTICSLKDIYAKASHGQIIDLRSQPNGVYMILVKNSRHSMIRKVVINK